MRYKTLVYLKVVMRQLAFASFIGLTCIHMLALRANGEVVVPEAPPRTKVVLSLGYSYITYVETAMSPIQMRAMTAKMTLDYLLIPPWLQLGANGFINVVPFAVKGTEKSVRFTGANLKLGVTPPLLPDPWSFSVIGGLAYAHMLVEDRVFGYSNLVSFQFFPLLSVVAATRVIFSIYGKYVPYAFPPSLQACELATGVGLQFPIGEQDFTINLDVSRLRIKPQVLSHEAFSASLSLGWVL